MVNGPDCCMLTAGTVGFVIIGAVLFNHSVNEVNQTKYYTCLAWGLLMGLVIYRICIPNRQKRDYDAILFFLHFAYIWITMVLWLFTDMHVSNGVDYLFSYIFLYSVLMFFGGCCIFAIVTRHEAA